MTTPLCCLGRNRRFRRLWILIVGLVAVWTLSGIYWRFWLRCAIHLAVTEQIRDRNDTIVYTVNVNHPFIFIGGMPRSGTTLMRAILDSHSSVRCGVETRVVPRVLQMMSHWETEKLESSRLKAAGILGQPLESATAAFIMQIMMRNGAPSSRLCAKDPYSLAHSRLLNRLFPNSKFILMLRDGRAVVHSAISRKVRITGYDLNKPLECLARWNMQIKVMYRQCIELGSTKCMTVRYEDLVLDPQRWIYNICEFLGLSAESAMLTPWLEIGGEVKLSETERSSDQVKQPLYLKSLAAWVGAMTPEFILTAPRIAPMLAGLGYDTERLPPRYGQPNKQYWHNTTY